MSVEPTPQLPPEVAKALQTRMILSYVLVGALLYAIYRNVQSSKAIEAAAWERARRESAARQLAERLAGDPQPQTDDGKEVPKDADTTAAEVPPTVDPQPQPASSSATAGRADKGGAARPRGTAKPKKAPQGGKGSPSGRQPRPKEQPAERDAKERRDP